LEKRVKWKQDAYTQRGFFFLLYHEIQINLCLTQDILPLFFFWWQNTVSPCFLLYFPILDRCDSFSWIQLIPIFLEIKTPLCPSLLYKQQ
jgi:hypothetical protein